MPAEKKLSYRDQTGAPLEAHANHWDGFTFSGGPWKVQCKGPAGNLQVWASSQAEGVRVLSHALAMAGVAPEDDRNSWSALRVNHPRFQTVRSWRVKVWQGAVVVTKRPGPSGPPDVVTPDP